MKKIPLQLKEILNQSLALFEHFLKYLSILASSVSGIDLIVFLKTHHRSSYNSDYLSDNNR